MSGVAAIAKRWRPPGDRQVLRRAKCFYISGPPRRWRL